MARKLVRKNPKKLFEQSEDFIKAHPDLNQSYSQFLQDLKKYMEFQQSQEKRQEKGQELSDYLIFGASFEKEL